MRPAARSGFRSGLFIMAANVSGSYALEEPDVETVAAAAEEGIPILLAAVAAVEAGFSNGTGGGEKGIDVLGEMLKYNVATFSINV